MKSLLVLLLSAFPIATVFSASQEATITIPPSETRIVLSDFHIHKDESKGDPSRFWGYAKPRTDEYFCGYKVRLTENHRMKNSVFEVYGPKPKEIITINSAIYHGSVANQNGPGSLWVEFDSRYVKKDFFKSASEDAIKSMCNSEGWSMNNTKNSKENLNNPGAPWECRDGHKFCRDNNGNYYGCGECAD